MHETATLPPQDEVAVTEKLTTVPCGPAHSLVKLPGVLRVMTHCDQALAQASSAVREMKSFFIISSVGGFSKSESGVGSVRENEPIETLWE